MGLSGSKLYCLNDGHITPANEALYQTEADLQLLIAENPRLLLRDPDDSERELYLIQQEFPLQDTQNGPFTYSLDHLFIDQDGVPVLVEVKRSTDTRIRREVAGQMLDYATRLRMRDVSELRAAVSPAQGIPETLWPTVEENLKAERMKLNFAADDIPDSLAVLIDFLDRSMTGIEVYGVEIKQYKTADGSVLVSSSIIGGGASREKSVTRPQTLWDAESMDAELERFGNLASIPIVSSLRAFAEKVGLQLDYGSRTKHGLVRAVRNGRKVFSLTSWEKVGTGLRTAVEVSLPSLVDQTAGRFDEHQLHSLLLSFPEASAVDTEQYIFGSAQFQYIDIRLLANPANMSRFQVAITQIVHAIPVR